MNETCHFCKTELIFDEENGDWTCPNPDCPEYVPMEEGEDA